MDILASMDISIRNVPPDLWHQIRTVAFEESTPSKRVTIREVVLRDLREWLAQRAKNVPTHDR